VARLLFFLAVASGGVGLFLYLAGWLLIPGEDEAESLGQRLAHRIEGTQAWFGIGLVILAGAILLNMLPFVDAGLLVPTILLVVGILLYRGELPRLLDGSARSRPPASGTVTAEDPETPSQRTPAPPRPRTPPPPPSPLGQLTVGLALLANGGLLIADRLSPLIQATWRHHLALTIAVLGVGLLVGTLWGRGRGLIVIGLAAAPFLIAVTAYEFTEVRINETFRPQSFEGLPATLERRSGSLTIDLTALPWEGQEYRLAAEMGVGEIDLFLPDNVALQLDQRVGIGALGDRRGGLGVSEDVNWDGPDGNMILDVEVGIGSIYLVPAGEGGLEGDGDFQAGDLFVTVENEEALAPNYATMDGDIVLDLSRLSLSEERTVQIEAPNGSIAVVLPTGISYRVRAHTDVGSISLFGEDVVSGGTVRSDSIGDGPVLELDLTTSQGDIVLTQEGERS
jgi:hypothetical protein